MHCTFIRRTHNLAAAFAGASSRDDMVPSHGHRRASLGRGPDKRLVMWRGGRRRDHGSTSLGRNATNCGVVAIGSTTSTHYLAMALANATNCGVVAAMRKPATKKPLESGLQTINLLLKILIELFS